MKLLQVMPKIFYTDLNIGMKFFIDGLGFSHGYKDDTICIVKRDNLTIQLVENAEFAKIDRPELRFITDDIEAFYEEISSKNPRLLHPNLNRIKDQPWGLREFALLDETHVCIIVQQA